MDDFGEEPINEFPSSQHGMTARDGIESTPRGTNENGSRRVGLDANVNSSAVGDSTTKLMRKRNKPQSKLENFIV